jgi:hypothetical protein
MKKFLGEHVEELSSLQRLHYAYGRQQKVLGEHVEELSQNG